MTVVDASVAEKWFVSEISRQQALRVRGAPERQAPDLIVLEVGNFAWKRASRGEITNAQARFICASLKRYFAVLHRSEALIDRAIDIALHLGHPIYAVSIWPAPSGRALVWSQPTENYWRCSPVRRLPRLQSL